ncbi:MAG: hypothetical protein CL532_10160 [Aestuariivita sp.]|nr:hypothetical protein [Aestuariivita sp.]
MSRRTLSKTSEFAPTWYEENAVPAPACHDISAAVDTCDVAIIGGGLAGLSAALHLALAGSKVVIIEKYAIGQSASGRNGGFCSSGWACSTDDISKMVGPIKAQALDDLAKEGLIWMRRRAFSEEYASCKPVNGCLSLSLFADQKFDISKQGLSKLIHGPRYKSGEVDLTAFHFHPLNFLRCLTRECLSAGVNIQQNCEVIKIRSVSQGKAILTLDDNSTTVTASKVIITTGGTGGAQLSKMTRLILPIQTFIVVSDPMPEIMTHHIPTEFSIADTRRAGNYFRKLSDGRLLWGMGISALSAPSQQKINIMATKNIAAHLPDLAKDMSYANINLAYAWSGTMGYARHFMPYVGQIDKNMFCAVGFGGHGMNTAPIAGKVIAESLLGISDRLEAFRSIPHQATFGAIGKTAAELYYRKIIIKDSIRERLA